METIETYRKLIEAYRNPIETCRRLQAANRKPEKPIANLDKNLAVADLSKSIEVETYRKHTENL